MLVITTTSERTDHWIKMRRSLAPFSGPESLVHTRSLADFITTTSGFRFSVHTGCKPEMTRQKIRHMLSIVAVEERYVPRRPNRNTLCAEGFRRRRSVASSGIKSGKAVDLLA